MLLSMDLRRDPMASAAVKPGVHDPARGPLRERTSFRLQALDLACLTLQSRTTPWDLFCAPSFTGTSTNARYPLPAVDAEYIRHAAQRHSNRRGFHAHGHPLRLRWKYESISPVKPRRNYLDFVLRGKKREKRSREERTGPDKAPTLPDSLPISCFGSKSRDRRLAR